MILPDHEITHEARFKDLGIEPFSHRNVQPASYDLTLGTEFIEYEELRPYTMLDPETGVDGLGNYVEADSYVLSPGEFVLATTRETITLPDDLSAEVKGRSSIGRLGVIPHTAGWIDPGFSGEITLEFVNHNPNPVVLRAGMRCCQIVFQMLQSGAIEPYGEKRDSKYQGQSGVTASRIEEDGQ